MRAQALGGGLLISFLSSSLIGRTTAGTLGEGAFGEENLPVMDWRSTIAYQIFFPLNLVSLPTSQTVPVVDKRMVAGDGGGVGRRGLRKNPYLGNEESAVGPGGGEP